MSKYWQAPNLSGMAKYERHRLPPHPCAGGDVDGCPAGPTSFVKHRDVWLCAFHKELLG